jgi:hypothetical protein
MDEEGGGWYDGQRGRTMRKKEVFFINMIWFLFFFKLIVVFI